MEREKVVLVRCSFLRGAFPHERIFVIRLADGWEYRGVAHSAYCLTLDHQPVGDAPPSGSELEGLLMGIQIARIDDGLVRVQLPDGDVYELPEDQLDVPSGSRGNIRVPVES
jgi:hypothetical protein